MYNKELFFLKKHIFSSSWHIYAAHGRIHVILHLSCNTKHNAIVRNICISGFRCRPLCYNLHLLQLAPVSPSSLGEERDCRGGVGECQRS